MIQSREDWVDSRTVWPTGSQPDCHYRKHLTKKATICLESIGLLLKQACEPGGYRKHSRLCRLLHFRY